MSVDKNLKGILSIPEIDYKHHYYLYIVEGCASCGGDTCIYRPKGVPCRPLRVFMNFLAADETHEMTDIKQYLAWKEIFKKAVMNNDEKVKQLYHQDILKFGRFFLQVEKEIR